MHHNPASINLAVVRQRASYTLFYDIVIKHLPVVRHVSSVQEIRDWSRRLLVSAAIFLSPHRKDPLGLLCVTGLNFQNSFSVCRVRIFCLSKIFVVRVAHFSNFSERFRETKNRFERLSDNSIKRRYLFRF